jgi:hypothetical protein
MATLQEALENAQRFMNLKTNLISYIRKTGANFTTANKEQLFTQSEDIFGNPLGFYSKATEEITNGRKKEGEPFTSVDTGVFFRGFFMKVVNDRLIFGSTDTKTNDILKSKSWLTHELFGLSDDSLAEIIEKNILPFVQNESRILLKL